MTQGLRESAFIELSTAAEEHWSDGALDVSVFLHGPLLD